MNRIYLVRHGENPANLTKEFSHRIVDYPLTPKGVIQAQQTAAFFRNRDIHEIYASPLRRALQTAEIIGETLGLPVTVVEEFREVNVGALERQPPSDENWALYFRIAEDWFTGRPESTFPEGEDYHTLWRRMRVGLAHILDGKTDRNIVVVGHGGIFTVTLRDLCPGVDLAMLVSTNSHNCSVSELLVSLDNGTPRAELVSWASHGHLTGEAARLVLGVPEEHVAERRRRSA